MWAVSLYTLYVLVTGMITGVYVVLRQLGLHSEETEAQLRYVVWFLTGFLLFQLLAMSVLMELS